MKPLCVYCVESDAATEDHVVPEGFFEEAPENGYIKVPACYSCNNRISRDEEYFLVAILAEATEHSETANRVLDRLGRDHRSGRRRRTGLAIALLEKVRSVSAYGAGGIYLGTAQGVELDTDRINRVLEKILRGLYFHHYASPLPRDARLYVEIKPDAARLRSPEIANALSQMPHVMGDVFMYHLYTQVDATSWAFHFYGTVDAIGVTLPPGKG